MKTVEQIKAMLNEVKGTVEDFKEFSKTNEKILEVKILLKMEKIKEIFNKYSEILKELKELRKVCYKTNYLSYMNIYINSDDCFVLVFDENDNIYPAIERRSYSYLTKLEANEKFTEEICGNCRPSWCSEPKKICTISKELAKKFSEKFKAVLDNETWLKEIDPETQFVGAGQSFVNLARITKRLNKYPFQQEHNIRLNK